MLQESTSGGRRPEIENIKIAADLLQRMLSELKDLAVSNSRLHFAMPNSGHAIRQRLDMLTGMIELLESTQEPRRARELGQRARALVGQLASEFELLALQAEHDFDWST